MKTLQRTTFLTTALLLLTAIHHAYGAVIYHTPWRLHILFIAIPVLLLVYVLDWQLRKHPGSKPLLVGYLIAVILFPLLVIGLYEGVYNHLAKNIIFLVTGNNSFFRMLFPPPVYEMPNDVWFEVTGILQAFVFYPLLISCSKMIKSAARYRKQMM
ncbi:MAG: hypothetical protein J7623_12960 [Chitinophaga sp.]|uniref:hypothetical protein n=1 Tax=Chitinophaga sp. TaxID=1869181 RepID=UPI001B05271E|nr:hypothetical protein [Chitinophaga sp.]MBO9729540.1 hypothetical protein [Chitinophaga sp.]